MAKPDWEAIETAYRAGVMSLREIASHHGISEGAIRKRAKRDDWSRDLNARIQQKADDLVRKTVRTKTELTERVLIEATAEVIASVRMEHRGDIRRARELTNTLFDELGAQCADVGALEQLGDIMFAPDDKGRDRLNETYQKVISLPSRVKSLKDLSDSLKTLIGLEREAWSISTVEPEKTPLPGKDTDLTTDQAAELYKKMMS
ncbi:hypothetical protein JJV51_000013 [Salmonella enterica subsp. enterica serovar Javiana]|nr:hypothetical protein [Salmonella enterica subsp. salamae]EDV6099053.1 hypothetical protein [Salmonella enterica subsp. enterica]EED9446793.1 hypothetical protein [Salmonella enterica subsp. enterica serovar Panama]EKQ9799686.1 hypothetical protein [Salmonella enterica subsp. enterica serovar Javiana]HAC6804024.1 hypothetical protein [Salmonella enterica subsp. enterica serovar Javiana]